MEKMDRRSRRIRRLKRRARGALLSIEGGFALLLAVIVFPVAIFNRNAATRIEDMFMSIGNKHFKLAREYDREMQLLKSLIQEKEEEAEQARKRLAQLEAQGDL